MTARPASGSRLFPLFLKLDGLPVLVVGGGPVALEKTRVLLASGARVHVVSTHVSAAFADVPVAIERRAFRATDVSGCFFVVAAATRDVNRAVLAAGNEERRFVVAVDDPEACTAYGAAVLERDGVSIAFSSSGRAPSLVALLRRAFDALLPDALTEWRLTAEAVRAACKAKGIPLSARTPLLLSALNALHAPPPHAWTSDAIDNGGAV